MRFAQPLIEGRLLRRYKRFLADVVLADGARVVAHCANPGSMRTCMPDGARVWLTKSDNPRRKLQYTWELVAADGAMVCVNTARANQVVAQALDDGVVAELRDCDEIHREVRYGAGSRVDFLLVTGGRQCYVEVKSVTLRAGVRQAAFPDSVTARGTKHLHDLMDVVASGHRGVMLFCCNRSDTLSMRPADEIDPVYGQTLRLAAARGVECLAYRCDVSPRGIWMRERIPLIVPALAVGPRSVGGDSGPSGRGSGSPARATGAKAAVAVARAAGKRRSRR